MRRLTSLICAVLIANQPFLRLGADTVQQTPTQTPVFKGRIDIIRTDVSVIDNKTGKPITGLTERDFTVTENGVRQSISSFLAKTPVREAEATAGEPPVAPRNRRVFLFVFGTGHLEGPIEPYSGVIHFLRDRLQPGDLAGVMMWNRVTSLTTDHELVARVVERYQQSRDAVFATIRRDGVKRQDPSEANQAAIDAALLPPGAPSGFLRSATALLIGTTEYRQNDQITRWNGELMLWDLLKATVGIEYLRNLEGEKHLVVFSNYGFALPIRLMSNSGTGFRLDSAEDDRRIAARANDAGVAIDIVHTIGTEPGIAWTISSRNVAEHSGGQFTSLRTAEEQLARIDDASRSGYIIGYQPTDPALNDRYRNIAIAVGRRDVTVVYRRGYTARAEAPPVDPRSLLVALRIRNAATSDLPLDDIKIVVKAVPVAPIGGKPQLRVDLTIDASKLTLNQRQEKWEGAIDLMILCGNQNREVVGKVDQQMLLSMDSALFARAQRSGIPYSVVVPLSAPATQVKAIVYDFDGDRVGTANTVVR